jgi:sugar lactone lactonase YvrE
VFADLAGADIPPGRLRYDLSGPDGLAVDGAGRVYVCEYGAGRILVFGRDGRFAHEIAWDQQYLTNLALLDAHRIVVTGAAVNDRPPFAGKVSILGLPAELH